MKHWKILSILFIGICLAPVSYGAQKEASGKKRILIVDSYHREYLWSQYTNEGFCAAMLKLGYFDNKDQIAEFTKNDNVETSRVVAKKLWMDSKKKKNKGEKAKVALNISDIARKFRPDLIFLAEDNAAEYIGNEYLDSVIPVVFWGVNHTPVKYGLVDSKGHPGHNVTGVYQTTYYTESLNLLKTLVPSVKTFAVLSDDSTTGRIFTKAIRHLDRKGLLPVKLVETVTTDQYEVWKRRALELQDKADAFFVAQYSGLKDKNGKAVSDKETAAWYLTHIKIPETAGFRHRVVQGMLCSAEDSAYNQGYEAVLIAHDILAYSANPATYPPRAPKRGPLMVNRQRAKMLGIALTNDMGIEEYIEEASALEEIRG